MRVCVPLFVAIGDATAGQVVRGKLHDNPVTGENTDVIHSDLARNVAQNRMTVLELNLKHGIGRVMHEDPNVPNYGKKGRGVRLQAGMVIAIEPMVTMGSNHVSTGSDGWIVTTNDHLPAAHYENTVAITNDGPVILTTDAQGAWCSLQGGEM